MDRDMNVLTAEEIIDMLHLEPLESEGGFARRTYQSRTKTGDGEAAGTAIFYLLRGGSFSHLHRLTGDEIYHFYLGDPVELVELCPQGEVKKTVLGKDISHGEELQHLVPAGNWQGSCLCVGGEWALLGTTMCPGYTDDAFELGDAELLTEQYPAAEAEIMRLTGEPVY